MQKSLKTIRYIAIGGIFLIPIVPLIITGSLFFPFITGKNFFFRIITEILIGLWLILAIYDRKYRPRFTSRRTWILYFFISFITVLILSTIFGVYPFKSFWSNFERMEGLITFLHLLGYFLVLTSILQTEKLWRWFFHISLGISVIIAFYGIFQLAGALEIHQGGVRLDATLGNASYLAIYMVFHIFLALWYFLKTVNWYRWFYAPVAILEIVILYYTATRGAILGFIGGIFLSFILVLIFSQSKKAKSAAVGVVAIVFILIAGFLAFRNSDFIRNSEVLSRFATISLEEKTTQSRFVIWKMSWEGFKERPILGWGPENYNLVFNEYYEPILWKQEPWFDRAHNVFFDRLTTNGILGLLAYLGLFVSAIYYLLLKRRQYGFSEYDSGILIGLLSAYFFHNIFVFDNLTSFILFFSILGYLHFRVNLKEEIIPADKEKEEKKEDNIKPVLSAIIIIAVIFCVYITNAPGLLAAKNLLNAFGDAGKGNLEEAFNDFQKSISHNTFGSSEAREHLANFATKIIVQQGPSDELKSKVFEYAESEMKKQIEETPDDIRYMIFLGVLYNKAQRYDEAVEILEKAIELSPKKQQIYFELGTSYLNKKEYEKALEILKIPYELDPTFDEARKIYAVALIFAGRETEAEGILKEKYGTEILPDERFIRAYFERGQFDRVVMVWEKLIELDSNNAQYHVSLAASYLQIGQREKAIEHLQKAIELEPKFQQQGEYYINEIRAGRNP